MTIEYVAERAGTYHSNLVKIEQGKTNLSFWVMCRLLRAMKSSVSQFSKMKGPGKRHGSAYSFKNRTPWEIGSGK